MGVEKKRLLNRKTEENGGTSLNAYDIGLDLRTCCWEDQ